MLLLMPDLRGPAPGGAEARSPQADDLAPLVARCRQGDAAATKTLLATLGPSMLQMIRRVLGPSDPDVDDVLQEAFFGLLRALPGFRGDSTTRHFACRIATLSALKARRGRGRGGRGSGSGSGSGSGRGGGRDAPADPRPDVDEDCWAGADPHDWALASCRRQLLRRLLDELPGPQAEAMVLHCVAGLSVEEISAAVHCPAETVRSRLRRAKEALRERVAADPSMGDLLEESL